MRYLLVVGFSCKVYKKEPRIRLFFNEQLIDEFNVSNYPKSINFTGDVNKILNLKHPLEPYTLKTTIKYIKDFMPPLRFYNLNVEDQLQRSQIRIDVDNNDNNYNNGFMTKSTLLQFKILSLLPADRKIYEWFKLKSWNQKYTHKYAYYWKKPSNNFFMLQFGSTWLGKNQRSLIAMHDIGGSGSLHCELIKKYGILLPKLLNPKQKYIYVVTDPIHKLIYDKYEQYANQRSSN
jgi:hypothetical protein